MVEVSLDDPRFTQVPRVHSTLVIKRKGVNLYKGRLCVRGDTAPLQTTGFVSSPTAHRCCVKVICAIASQMNWAIRAIDISQAFLQSPNLNPKDRAIAIPPSAIHLPWAGKLPPHEYGYHQGDSPKRISALEAPLWRTRCANEMVFSITQASPGTRIRANEDRRVFFL